MSKRVRWLLFVAAVILFVVASYIIVVYALGYEYDFVAHVFVQTGSFRVIANTNADVYVNGLLTGQTSFLGTSYSRGRLLPRTYTVSLQKNGYHTWQKSIPIFAGYFSDFPRVILMPDTLSEIVIATSSFDHFSSMSFDAEHSEVKIQIDNKNGTTEEIINIETGAHTIIYPLPVALRAPRSTSKQTTPSSTSVLAPDENKIVLMSQYEVSVQWLRDADYQPFNKRGDTVFVARFPVPITNVQWYRDSSHIFIHTGALIKFAEIDKRGGINSYDIAATSYPFYYDQNRNVLFYFDSNKLKRILFD